MFCKNCGAANQDGAPVCASCGAPLTAAQQPYMQQPAYPPPASYGAPAAFPAASSSKRRLNILGALGALLAIISVFLPFVKVEVFGYSDSVSLFNAEGGSDWIFVVAIGAVGLILALAGLNVGVMIMGLLEIGIGWLEIHDLDEKLGMAAGFVSKGLGCWLLFAAGAVMILGGVVGIASKRK